MFSKNYTTYHTALSTQLLGSGFSEKPAVTVVKSG